VPTLTQYARKTERALRSERGLRLFGGSTWGLRVTLREGGGSSVEMTLERRFRNTPPGLFAALLNHLAGRRGWSWYLQSALKAVENASAPQAGSDAANATA
jgi:hypothetical protein